MEQIYRTARGPALLVRYEDREGVKGALFAVVKDRAIWYLWHTTLPDDFELVHDPACRAEVNIIAAENGALVREKEVLLECLGAALGQLDERSANQVRDIYKTKIKTADLISLTKVSDLAGASKGA